LLATNFFSINPNEFVNFIAYSNRLIILPAAIAVTLATGWKASFSSIAVSFAFLTARPVVLKTTIREELFFLNISSSCSSPSSFLVIIILLIPSVLNQYEMSR
jgi:hypothetical protein